MRRFGEVASAVAFVDPSFGFDGELSGIGFPVVFAAQRRMSGLPLAAESLQLPHFGLRQGVVQVKRHIVRCALLSPVREVLRAMGMGPGRDG